MGEQLHPIILRGYNQKVRPIMEYACEIWFQEKPIEHRERVQLKYLKDVLRLRQRNSDLAIFDETGQFPLFVRQQDLLLKHWLRILRLPKQRIMNLYHFLSMATTTLRKKSDRLSSDTVMPTIIFTKCLTKRHVNFLSAKSDIPITSEAGSMIWVNSPNLTPTEK